MQSKESNTPRVPESIKLLPMAERMAALGLIGPPGGIQVDVTVAQLKLTNGYVDATLCDHNCKSGENAGNYECPAAISLNKGLKIKTMVPAPLIIEGVKRTAQGIFMANQVLIRSGWLDNYFITSQIPPEAQPVFIEMLQQPPYKMEVNLFGGNPELHPDILTIIKTLKDLGMTINLTTTGGRLMRDPKFLEAFLSTPPDKLAVSADDFESVEQVSGLAKLAPEEIHHRWQKIPPQLGQKRKAVEAAWILQATENDSRFPKILVNLVVHPGNIDFIEELIIALHSSFPKSTVNPYPAQSSFSAGEFKPVWQYFHLPLLERFVDQRIAENLQRQPGMVPRLHYYLMLKAIFNTYRNDPESQVKCLSGVGVWNCCNAPGAGRYVQIGGSETRYQDPQTISGGHLSCFWNRQAITDPGQVWEM